MAADLIVVDTPPILRVADTLELARDADQVVIVMRDGHSRMRQVTAAVHQLRQVGGAFSGVVLNQITGKDGQYHYGYGQQPAPQTVVSPSGAPPR